MARAALVPCIAPPKQCHLLDHINLAMCYANLCVLVTFTRPFRSFVWVWWCSAPRPPPKPSAVARKHAPSKYSYAQYRFLFRSANVQLASNNKTIAIGANHAHIYINIDQMTQAHMPMVPAWLDIKRHVQKGAKTLSECHQSHLRTNWGSVPLYQLATRVKPSWTIRF